MNQPRPRLVALCSAKGSPGVTVTALACLLAWSAKTLLVECDPAGGDIAAGYLRETRLDGRGLANLTTSLQRGHLARDLWDQLVDLAPGGATALTRLVLPGLTDPAQAGAWSEPRVAGQPSGWDQLAYELTHPAAAIAGYQVLADCGRLAAAHPPAAVLRAADAVLLVVHPTIPSVRAAAAAVGGLAAPGNPPVGLVIVGDGPYKPREVGDALPVPVVAVMPDDPAAARVLSGGGELRRGRLLRAAARAAHTIAGLADSRSVTPPVIAPARRRQVPSVR